MRIDSHQHYWRIARGDYGWLTPERGAIYRDYGPADLAPLMMAIRQDARFLGTNVTVPYKQAVIPLLDVVDARARQLDAVNTVVRTPDGELHGFNTDGEGAIGSLTRGCCRPTPRPTWRC